VAAAGAGVTVASDPDRTITTSGAELEVWAPAGSEIEVVAAGAGIAVASNPEPTVTVTVGRGEQVATAPTAFTALKTVTVLKTLSDGVTQEG
jgi:hypothetical protein